MITVFIIILIASLSPVALVYPQLKAIYLLRRKLKLIDKYKEVLKEYRNVRELIRTTRKDDYNINKLYNKEKRLRYIIKNMRI